MSSPHLRQAHFPFLMISFTSAHWFHLQTLFISGPLPTCHLWWHHLLLVHLHPLMTSLIPFQPTPLSTDLIYIRPPSLLQRPNLLPINPPLYDEQPRVHISRPFAKFSKLTYVFSQVLICELYLYLNKVMRTFVSSLCSVTYITCTNKSLVK